MGYEFVRVYTPLCVFFMFCVSVSLFVMCLLRVLFVLNIMLCLSILISTSIFWDYNYALSNLLISTFLIRSATFPSSSCAIIITRLNWPHLKTNPFCKIFKLEMPGIKLAISWLVARLLPNTNIWKLNWTYLKYWLCSWNNSRNNILLGISRLALAEEEKNILIKISLKNKRKICYNTDKNQRRMQCRRVTRIWKNIDVKSHHK